MNYLWGGMILVGVVYAAMTGNLGAVTDQALASAKEAVSLCLTMTGAMAFWVGLMKIVHFHPADVPVRPASQIFHLQLHGGQ